MGTVPPVRYMTVEEYLKMEETSLEKHEFIGGVIKEISSTGFQRSQILSNCFIGIGNFLRGKLCRIYGSSLKVKVKGQPDFVHPDLTVICGEVQFLEGRQGIVTNPSVVIEVLVDNTNDYGYIGQFVPYREIESLREYICISSSEIRVEEYKREAADAWRLRIHSKIENVLDIGTINFQMPLAEIYRDVEFDEKDWSRGIVRERG